jgi:DNA-binding response OmpR family regulator
MVLCSLKDLLTSAGYGVTGCADICQALKMANLRRFGLAILDLPRKDESVHDLVRLLRGSVARIKLLALTTAERANVFPGLEVDGIAVKPFPHGNLLRTVAALIGPPKEIA